MLDVVLCMLLPFVMPVESNDARGRTVVVCTCGPLPSDASIGVVAAGDVIAGLACEGSTGRVGATVFCAVGSGMAFMFELRVGESFV